jgi:hypothetical protein
MKKYISLFALPLFLVVFSSVISTKVKYAEADVPQSCPEGSQRLTFADGSGANANIGPAGVFNNQQNIDQGIRENIIRWGNANGWKREMLNEQLLLLPILKAYAFDMSTAAGLAEVVKGEGGGGPFCYNPQNSSIYEALSNQNCSVRFPGTQFAGFRVVELQPTYMCGTPSPWTDG